MISDILNIKTVYLSTAGILTVLKANDDVAEEYNKIITEEIETEVV